MSVVSMSNKEFARLDVLLGLEARRIHVADACSLLGLKRRQVFRLLQAYRERGATSLVSNRHGRPSSNRLPDAVRDLVVGIVRERYTDLWPNPTKTLEQFSTASMCQRRSPDSAKLALSATAVSMLNLAFS